LEDVQDGAFADGAVQFAVALADGV